MRAGRYGVVGRSEELSDLDKLVVGVAGGMGGIGWIQGEPGIGKSALVDLVASTAREAGAVVFRSGGDELMSAFPLRVMADCLGVSARSSDPARVEIAKLLRGEGQSGTIDPVLAAAERLLELVDRLATASPLTLIVEDLHWADEPSLLLWNRLTRVTNQIPILLLGTCRPVPVNPKVDRLRVAAQEHDGLVIDLGPLATAEVVEMATQLTAGRPGPRLAEELTRAGGNPLYVRELVHAMQVDRLVELSGDVAELSGPAGTTPGSLPAAIGRRLSFLSGEALPVLRLAALLGNGFRGSELAPVSRKSVAQLSAITDEAAAAGVISDTGKGFVFRHDLIRQALVEQTPAAMRGALHSDIARALAEAGSPIYAVARHLLAASEGLDPWALGWLAEIPESTLYAAPQMSADLLTRALPLLQDTDPRWEKLVSRLIQTLFWMGRDQQLREVAASALLRFRDLELSARSRIHWARSALRNGVVEEGLGALEPALHLDEMPPLWQARLNAWTGHALIRNQRVEEGRALAQQALTEARRNGDPLGIGYALSALVQVSDAQTQLAYYDEMLAGLGEDPDSMDLRTANTNNRAGPLIHTGRPREAQETVRAAGVLAERTGSYRSVTVSAMATEVAYIIGNWDEALVDLAGIGPDYLQSPALTHLNGIGALIALHREDRDLAISHLRAGGLEDFTSPPKHGTGAYLTPALVLLAESEGKPQLAFSLQKQWLQLNPYLRFLRQSEAYSLIRAALAIGDTATASAAAAAASVENSPNLSPNQVLCSRSCHALLADDPAELLAVAGEASRNQWPEDSTFAYEEAAVRLAAAGDMAQARKAFTEAVQIYGELGATWDIRRADARLRPYGIKRGSRSLHRREKVGWGALTPTETRIARLVALGKSNPDISSELYVSRNTVQTHVSNILAKLQLRSRIELIREITQHLPTLES